MSNIIRKIIIGKDIINDSMNYTVGQSIRQRDGAMKITEIIQDDNDTITIYVERDGTKFAWKKISPSVATTIEFSTTF